MANSTVAKSSAKSPRTAATTTKLQSHQKRRKPKFSLWLHSTGQWAKKIRGHIFYFGTDKEKALEEYVRVREDREAGREPPPANNTVLTVKLLVNTFLTHKKSQVNLGDIGQRQFDDYERVAERMADHFGRTRPVTTITPADLLKYRDKFAADGSKSPHTIGNEVQRVRVILRFAFENGLIDRPIRFGDFKRPSKSAFRRHRQAIGSRQFEPSQLRQLIDAADVHLKAMILLGVNCGFGGADCGSLLMSALNLDTGWIDFPRPKTGIERRCPLWPITVASLHESLQRRKNPHNPVHGGLVFVTKYGGPWYHDKMRGGPVSAEFRKLLNREKLYRRGFSFYSLRHCFQTIGDETGDYLAVRKVMGHADNSISDHYRERFPHERLQRVVDHVHSWLYPRPTVLT